MTETLVVLDHVVKHFPVGDGFFRSNRAHIHAVNGVSLTIERGETLGLVGESGCGKSTLGLLTLKLLNPDAGHIHFAGQEITHFNDRQMRPLRREMQIVFQDPFASLNPRMTIGEIVGEPLIVHRVGTKAQRRERVAELLTLVGLSKEAETKYPHEFSGGQRQRIGIARAIALTPKLIVADEPVSALDVSIRGEIVNLLMDLQDRLGLTSLFISHDLHVVGHISHRIAVMYLGKIMECFPAAEMALARHPYTQALMSAIPVVRPGKRGKRIVLAGDVPSPLAPPRGCPFHPRCRYAQPVCAEKEPPLESYREGLVAACHFIREMGPVGDIAQQGGEK